MTFLLTRLQSFAKRTVVYTSTGDGGNDLIQHVISASSLGLPVSRARLKTCVRILLWTNVLMIGFGCRLLRRTGERDVRSVGVAYVIHFASELTYVTTSIGWGCLPVYLIALYELWAAWPRRG